MDDMEKRKILPLPEFEIRTINHLAHGKVKIFGNDSGK
jgi:hypothetical protein